MPVVVSLHTLSSIKAFSSHSFLHCQNDFRVSGKNVESFDDLTKFPDILVVGGRSPNPTSAVEVVSFKEVATEPKFPNFPYDIAGLISKK